MTIIEYPRNFILVSIEWYQVYLSPRKGFCCAHRVLHGTDSCSEWIKRLVLRVGVIRAVPLSIRRFRSCNEAYEILSQNYSKNKAIQNDNEEKEFEDCPCAKKNDAVCCLAEVVALPCYII